MWHKELQNNYVSSRAEQTVLEFYLESFTWKVLAVHPLSISYNMLVGLALLAKLVKFM